MSIPNSHPCVSRANYAGCLQNLNKLDRPQDLKLAHNKAVAEYYRSDCRKTEQFQKALKALFGQFRLRIDKLDDVDHCLLHYNRAVLLFHQRQYDEAVRVMEKVYKFIEALGKKQGFLVAIVSRISV